MDRDAAKLSVFAATQKLRQALEQVVDPTKLHFQLENMQITARRFQLPRLDLLREMVGQLEDLSRSTQAVLPECLDAAAKLRRYGPMAIKAQQLKHSAELQRCIGLAERMAFVGNLEEEQRSLNHFHDKLRDIRLSPDDLIASLLERLDGVPLPTKLKQLVALVQTESPATPWTASDLRDPDQLARRATILQRHTHMLDQIVAVLVHQRNTIPMEEADLMEAVQFVDALQILIKTIKELSPLCEVLLEKLTGVEEVVRNGYTATGVLIALLAPLLAKSGISIDPAVLRKAGRIKGQAKRAMLKTIVLGLYSLTALLILFGAGTLTYFVVKRESITLKKTIVLLGVLSLICSGACCIAATWITAHVRSLRNNDIVDEDQVDNGLESGGGGGGGFQQRGGLLQSAREESQRPDPRYVAQGPGMGGKAWREDRQGALPRGAGPGNVRERLINNTDPVSRAAEAARLQANPLLLASLEDGGVDFPHDAIDDDLATEIAEYGVFLGIDPERDPDLLWIAQQAYFAPLPPPWTEHADPEGNVYFFNPASQQSTWAHPLEETYRALAAKYLEEKYLAGTRAGRGKRIVKPPEEFVRSRLSTASTDRNNTPKSPPLPVGFQPRTPGKNLTPPPRVLPAGREGIPGYGGMQALGVQRPASHVVAVGTAKPKNMAARNEGYAKGF